MADLDPPAMELPEDYPPLGLADPLLPPEPLGQDLLYPQFLVPVVAEPMAATNPSMFFTEGIPGYQPPENPFQESPFFAEARASLRMGQVALLPEFPQGVRRVPRPILSDLLDDLELQTDLGESIESPEPTTNERDTTEVPPLEEEAEVLEEQEIQPASLSAIAEEKLPPFAESETEEFVESPLENETAPLSPEAAANPLAIPEAIDTSSGEPVPSPLPPQGIETALLETTVLPPPVSEEVSPLAQPEESLEATEPAVVSESSEQLSNEEIAALPETEPAQANPEPMAVASAPPAFAEEIIASAPETNTPESELLPTSPTATSLESSNFNLEQIAPEAEEISKSPELTTVQNATESAEAVQATPLEPENLTPLKTPEVIPSEELSSVAESASEETKPLPEKLSEELSNEAPVVPPEETASEIAETPISHFEVTAAALEEKPVMESTLPLVEVEAAPSIPAQSEPVEELERPEPLPIPELLQTPQGLPSSEVRLESPAEIIPAIEPAVAAQNLPEEAVAVPSEPLAATAQEAVGPQAGLSPENEPEASPSPPLSRIQELIEQQIEAFSGLEQEELEEETVAPALESAVSTVSEENASETAVAENAPLEIPALESVATTTAESTEIEQVERPSLQNEPVSSETSPEGSTEEFTPLSNLLERLGILTPLITAPPLAQLSNFLPITFEPFSSGRRAEMPLGLEQPMTFVSPNNLRPNAPPEQQPLVLPVAISENSPVINPSVAESMEENVYTVSLDIDNLKNEPTEAINASRQEEPPSQTEALNPLLVGIALPIQLNEESFRPLIFSPRSPRSAQNNVPETLSPEFSPSSSRAKEQFSLEDLISENTPFNSEEFTSLFGLEAFMHKSPEETGYTSHEVTSLMHSHLSEIYEGQGFTSVSIPSEWGGDEHVASYEEGEEITIGETEEGEEFKPDLEAIAQEIYGLLRQRLEIERERQGHYSGRLPW